MSTSAAKPFTGVTRDTQVRRLRRAAERALGEFGHADASLRLVQHDFNTTFRVDTTDGQRFAMRLNIGSDANFDEVAAEVAWVDELATNSDILVPEPQHTPDGAAAIAVDVAGLANPVPTVLYRWIQGHSLPDQVTLRQAAALGQTTAALHNHTEDWQLPDGLTRPSFDSIHLNVGDNLTGLDAPWYEDADRQVIEEADAHIRGLTDKLLMSQPRMLIHADLHQWNVKWHDGKLGVFDFDDCGISSPILDLAITAFYLRPHDRTEKTLLESYSEVRQLPDHTDDQYEALVAGRSLLMFNGLITHVNVEYQEILPGYAKRTANRMRHYLDTGSFVLDP